VLEGVLLVLDPREELEHPWMSEGGGGGSLSLLPHHHTLFLGGVQPQGDVRAGESVVRVQPDDGADISEDGLDDKRSVCAQMKGVHMGRPGREVEGVEGAGRRVAILFDSLPIIFAEAEVKHQKRCRGQKVLSTPNKT